MPADDSPDSTVWVLDLDGVIWTGTDPIAGSAQAVADLVAAGNSVVFATNNSFSTIDQQETKLGSFGIDAVGRVVTSAQAAASLVGVEERVLILGGPGVHEAALASSAVVVDDFQPDQDDVPDAVIVGLDWKLSYDRLRAAVQAVLAGARFIATNEDRTYPTERGLYPGAGALVAAVRASTGLDPVVCGKPHEPMANLIRRRYGNQGIVVGDRPETDGLFAVTLGFEFALALSGVTGVDDLPVDPTPQRIGDDLAELVRTAPARRATSESGRSHGC